MAGRAIAAPELDRGERKKHMNIEEAANGFIVNSYEYEHEYGGKPRVFRTAEDVAEAVKKFLEND